MASRVEVVYPPEIANTFSIKETIGSGGFAKVKVAKHKITGEKVAIKIMEKTRLKETHDLHRAPLEIQALKDLKHPHISRLYQVVETPERYFLVMEFAPGGELFDYIVAKDRLKEDEAREFFRQIISAVGYMHQSCYIHRDLKPENLLLDANQKIKLIDFGLIGHPSNALSDMLKTCCGSAAYAAPELIRGEMYIGPPADVWSLGILLYALLCGFLPFDDDDTQRLYKLIQRGTYEIPSWLSKESEELLGQMLKHKPEHRITIQQLRRHPWVLAGTTLTEVDVHANFHAVLDQEVIAEMAKFYATDVPSMEASILEWKYDEKTVLYELMCRKHKAGTLPRLPSGKSHLPGTQAMAFLNSKPTPSSLGQGSSELMSFSSKGSELSITTHNVNSSKGSQASVFPSEARVSITSPLTACIPTSPDTKRTRGRAETVAAMSPTTKPKLMVPTSDTLERSKLFVSQGIDAKSGLDKAGIETMYRPTSHEDMRAQVRTRGSQPIHLPPIVNASSERNIASTTSTTESTRSASPGQYTGLKGSFNRLTTSIKSAFGSSRNLNEPKVVKGLFNVNTTSVKEPHAVMAELMRVIKAHPNLQVTSDGFMLKVKYFNLSSGKHEMTIVFEVCKISRTEITGVRLKRVKGDTWQYKKLCQELLTEAKL